MKLTAEQRKHIKKLSQKKYRDEFGEFVVEGEKSVQELMQSDFDIQYLVIEKERGISVDSANCDAYECSKSEGEAITAADSFSGVLAVARQKNNAVDYTEVDGPIVVLDHINDPGNLGTIIRTADWFGIKNILVSENSADIYNPKVVRSSMGSLFHISVGKSKNILEDLMAVQKEGYVIAGLSMDGDDISNLKPTKEMVYVFGSESHGIHPEVEKMLDARYTIPGKGKAESLNVAISAGIVLSRIT